ncbi:elongation of very long chain fatty acids protein 1-like isoform X2 [Varroa jacobsoni]|uniref:Elongation of very long chain fatty acids protein n=1 Tax=Varroa destructor TaxID=109461 RepID=A0A7M7KC31_VARDE|nr:elongation of very long chain fatty acids protein 1-like isoform X2 [Varroa destructor]XP_022698602.1 elongation of very long chain fatty acids protein 1-like isoform X2 [Varroa jacobsoni]
MEVLSSMWHSLEQDPRLKGRPLIDSPVPVFSIIGTYLIFVLRVGPQMMRDRKPVNVKSFARVFNLYQVLISAWTVYTVCVCCYKLGIGYGEPPNTQRDPTTMRLINCLYIYLFVRISDLIDTVLFVLSASASLPDCRPLCSTREGVSRGEIYGAHTHFQVKKMKRSVALFIN